MDDFPIYAAQRTPCGRWLIRVSRVDLCLPAYLVAALDERSLDAVQMLRRMGLIPMAIDYRELLKAAIRGTIYEYDIPSPPALIELDSEAIPPDREARADTDAAVKLRYRILFAPVVGRGGFSCCASLNAEHAQCQGVESRLERRGSHNERCRRQSAYP